MIAQKWFNYAKVKNIFELYLEIMNYYIIFAPKTICTYDKRTTAQSKEYRRDRRLQ